MNQPRALAQTRDARNIIAIDTTFEACSVAVACGLGTLAARIAARFEGMATGQAERVMPMAEDALREAGLARRDLDLVAVTTGPGSFTGTRIGIAAAKGLALGFGVPVAGLSSLHVIGRQAVIDGLPGTGGGCDIVIAADMGREDIYAQVLDGSALTARTEPVLVNAVHIEDFARSSGALLLGRGERFRPENVLPKYLCIPRAETLVVLVTQCEVKIDDVLPLYLRPPDAKPRLDRGAGINGRPEGSLSKPEG